ncbi:UNVERIFIED_CONTAM: HAMP domain-containing histidine kinase, partial [Salmonella enterica subsp. enterica serovar Weltevreden]
HFEHDFESDHEISVKGNEYLLKTAFCNLFDNGCKFSKDHQSTVSVSFQTDKILLMFTDKGIGITEEDFQHIFTPFYRGENKAFADGNGIGLSLTQKIIQLHQGKITVISAPAAGTVFTVELPSV